MMNKPVIIFLLILYLLAGCQQKRQPLTKLLTPEDSVAVLQTVLSYAPLNSLMSEFKGAYDRTVCRTATESSGVRSLVSGCLFCWHPAKRYRISRKIMTGLFIIV